MHSVCTIFVETKGKVNKLRAIAPWGGAAIAFYFTLFTVIRAFIINFALYDIPKEF